MGRLTLWGMQQAYPDLLEGVTLPGQMSRNDFVQILNLRVGTLYPYIQVPPVLQVLIQSWFVTRQEEFQRMYDALWAEYSPIENYDRHEERHLDLAHSGTDTDTNTLGSKVTVTRTGTESTSHTGNETVKTTGTDKTVTSGTETVQTSGTDTTQHTGIEENVMSVSAYDASSYVPREQNNRSPDLTDTRTPNLTDTRTPNLTDLRTPDLTESRAPDLTDTRTPDLTDTSTNSGSDTRQTDYGHKEHTDDVIHAHGNIGVTTNQQMIESEISLRLSQNLYDIIIGLFEREFLSQVY